MLKNEYKLYVTGTIKKNKPHIPAEMKVAGKEIPSTKFCHHENITLAGFTPKKNKIVLIASTKITTGNIGEKGKPEVILYYNKRKGGTDVFDKLCHAYTTTRATQRWPMRYFFGMLDQSIVNARILYTCKYSNDATKKKSAVEALKDIVAHLVQPFLQQRLENGCLRVDVRKGIEHVLGMATSHQNEERRRLEKRARCQLCTRKQDNKTKDVCPSCNRPMCDDHRAFLCNDCAGYD